jgi:DNA polymerase I-like protein with 3'-5' exonuclease and polymerase domains
VWLLSVGWLIANQNFPTIDNDYLSHTHQLAFIHDELQWECLPTYAEDLKNHLELCAALAGEYYNLRIPIAAEGKIGSTWADVH